LHFNLEGEIQIILGFFFLGHVAKPLFVLDHNSEVTEQQKLPLAEASPFIDLQQSMLGTHKFPDKSSM